MFIAQDVSTNKLRANEFDLIENTTENLLNGTFLLPLKALIHIKYMNNQLY